MRQIDIERYERLYNVASKVVDAPVPTTLVWLFLPKQWRIALLELASAVNDMRDSSDNYEMTVIGYTKENGSTKLLVED